MDTLVKEYNNGIKALDGLNFEVNCGEIFTLLGPNGAGKSSLINILTTYHLPTSGSVFVLSKDLCKEANYIRSQIACVAQNISIDFHLSLVENMLFQSRLYKIDKITAKKRINLLIDSFKLGQYKRYPVASYSGGVKRRLDIAMNMISFPKILFLDEPTVGMDIQSRKSMWEMMKKIRNDFGTTIFLTTHYLEEAEHLSDNICIIKDGHKLVKGSPRELSKYTHQKLIKIGFVDMKEAKKSLDFFCNKDYIESGYVKENSVFLNVNAEINSAFKIINQGLLDRNISFVSTEILQPTLEDVFLYLTGSTN